MAHYVTADIHGDLERFERLLEIIDLKDEDTLYVLGDCVDRGHGGVTIIQKIMRMKNVVMLLGNHEYMCLDYFREDATDVEIRRWNKNGNAPTLKEIEALNETERDEFFAYLKSLPSELCVKVGEKEFYLVHGFYGENVHDRVWNRPKEDAENPLGDKIIVIGHTPVINYVEPDDDKQNEILKKMQEEGRHLEILHAKNFINVDCLCGYDLPANALACIRLEDFREYYAV